MKRLFFWFRDWRRGYTDADIISAHDKMTAPTRPGEVVFMSRREMRALRCPPSERRAVIRKAHKGSLHLGI